MKIWIRIWNFCYFLSCEVFKVWTLTVSLLFNVSLWLNASLYTSVVSVMHYKNILLKEISHGIKHRKTSFITSKTHTIYITFLWLHNLRIKLWQSHQMSSCSFVIVEQCNAVKVKSSSLSLSHSHIQPYSECYR